MQEEGAENSGSTGTMELDPSKQKPSIDYGPNWQDAFNFMKDDVDEAAATQTRAQAEKVYGELVNPSKAGRNVVLIFGMIQSGKTHTLCQSLGLAADNGFKLFLVLTSDNNSLYSQTAKRIRNSFTTLKTYGKEQVKPNQIEETARRLKQNLSNEGSGAIIVCSKNVKVLVGVLSVLQFAGVARVPAVIFDDEADQASLNANAWKKLPGIDTNPSAIHERITALRQYLTTNSYVAVTATPQALFLQQEGSLHRPNRHVVLTQGAGYQGGEHFHIDKPERYYREVDANEVAEYVDKASVIKGKLPNGMKKAVSRFLVAATMLRIKEAENARRAKYSMLMHISMSVAKHHQLQANVTDYVMDIAKNLRQRIPTEIQEAYDDIRKSLEEDGVPFAALKDVVEELRKRIASVEIREVNKDQIDSFDFSDKDNYMLYNIFIGGNVLGRGMTIWNLITTYYGRDSKSGQIDTVMQHARWYGYRLPLSPYIRVYMPLDLWGRFRRLYNHDIQLRGAAEDYLKASTGIVPLLVAGNLKPTRRNVLEPDSLGVYSGGKAYHQHMPDAIGARNRTPLIEEFLAKRMPSVSKGPGHKERVIGIVSLKDALWLLDQMPAGKAQNGTWDDEAIREALKTVCAELGDEQVRIVWGVDLKRSRGGEGESDEPGELSSFLEKTDRKDFAEEQTPPLPTIFVFRVKGDSHLDDGPYWGDGPWSRGQRLPQPPKPLKYQFYVPGVYFPELINQQGYGIVFRLP